MSDPTDPWWTVPADQGREPWFIDRGKARVHLKTAALVDAGVNRLEPLYAELCLAVDVACEAGGSVRRPWAAVGPCGSGIRTAFQPDLPDLEARVLLLYECDPGESLAAAGRDLAVSFLPRVIDALERAPSLKFHGLQLPWTHPNAPELLGASGDRTPWQAAHLWSKAEIARGTSSTPCGELSLEDGLLRSRQWTLMLAITTSGCEPVSLEVEFVPVPIHPATRRARDLLLGVRVSTLGCAFFRFEDAWGYRAIEQRALAVHGRRPVANYLEDLVKDARVLHSKGCSSRALELLVEPIAVAGDGRLVEVLRRDWACSVPLFCLTVMQTLRRLRGFAQAGSAPMEWIMGRYAAERDRVEARIGETSDSEGLRLLADVANKMQGSRKWLEAHETVVGSLSERIQGAADQLARRVFSDNPQLRATIAVTGPS